MERSEFEKLSKNLTEEERAELLSKIKNEQLENDSSENNKKEKKDNDISNQYKIAKAEFEKKGLLDKLLIFVAAFISGKNKEDVVLEKEFGKLKKEINGKYYNIIDFDKKVFTHNFANELILLYDSVIKILPIVDNFFSDLNYYYSFLYDMFEKRLSDRSSKFFKELDPENLKLNTTEFIEKNAFLREKDRKLKEFFDNIDKINPKELVNKVNNFELVLKLIKFEYTKVLQAFSLSNFKTLTDSYHTANFISIEKSIDKFYTLLYHLDFDIDDIISYVYEFSIYSKNNYISESQAILKKSFSDSDLKKFEDFLKSLKIFLEKIPLFKILKYIKKDLLYKPKDIFYDTNLISIYKDIKRKKSTEDWEKYYLNLKKHDLQRLVSELFSDYNFAILNNFSLDLYTRIFEKTSYKITSIYFINIITFFVTKFYRNNLENFINRILIEANFVDELSKFHLTGAYHILNNSIEKINTFDVKFAKDNEYGKKINLYLDRISNDIDLKRSFQNYIYEINDEGISLSNELHNALQNVYNFMTSLTETNKSEIPIVNLDSIRLSGNINIHSLIDKYVDILFRFFKIYKQIELIY
ncbi:MAG: hypothetical protein A2Y34_14755 [Spirochaetes bacterium GWC1_27_15]|nr:MAG: hypothetical protein A2Y34_14755 [Spirochaetes bacterium GWC1_27_15]